MRHDTKGLGMLVCHCRRVNDRAITAMVEEGARSVPEVVARCGAGSRCGGCQAAISRLLESMRSDLVAQDGPVVGTVA